ncbi:glycosyltransferase family 2 protein [Limnohabitans sp.]|uniref:glycosyltransferase family 2 protein n=1 Tax=Limnohabitans sp. TaxID=1907725 RepID=UPI002FDED91D
MFISILIPSNNRAGLLKKTYKFIDKIRLRPEKAEIIVYETGNEPSFDAECIKDGQYFTYIYSPENITLSEKLLYLQNNSKGKYIWYVADDDLYSEECLKFILNGELETFCKNNTYPQVIDVNVSKLNNNNNTEISLIKINNVIEAYKHGRLPQYLISQYIIDNSIKIEKLELPGNIWSQNEILLKKVGRSPVCYKFSESSIEYNESDDWKFGFIEGYNHIKEMGGLISKYFNNSEELNKVFLKNSLISTKRDIIRSLTSPINRRKITKPVVDYFGEFTGYNVKNLLLSLALRIAWHMPIRILIFIIKIYKILK